MYLIMLWTMPALVRPNVVLDLTFGGFFCSYVHVNHSLWHHNVELVAANRPDAAVNTFDWPDHACGLYQGALLLADNITLLA